LIHQLINESKKVKFAYKCDHMTRTTKFDAGITHSVVT